MTELTVTLCGQTTTIACAPEDEQRLQYLIAMIEQRAQNARSIVGDNDRWRQMLFTAIFLADELDGGVPPPAAPPGGGAGIADEETVARRVGALAARIGAALDRIDSAVSGA